MILKNFEVGANLPLNLQNSHEIQKKRIKYNTKLWKRESNRKKKEGWEGDEEEKEEQEKGNNREEETCFFLFLQGLICEVGDIFAQTPVC